jgi:nucleotide-binding universal stress UspA family protein
VKGRRQSQFKKILVDFDGPPQSEKATESTLALAVSLDAKVFLFAVARPPEPATRVEVDCLGKARQVEIRENARRFDY